MESVFSQSSHEVTPRGAAVRSRSILACSGWAFALGVLALGVMPRAALAAPCKEDGDVCQKSRSCCGTSGNNGVCVKYPDPGAKFGLCCTLSSPSTEVCGDGLDNDCDGAVDEGCVCTPGSSVACYDGPAGTAGVGTCAAGTKICNATGTAYGACVGAIGPTAEVCDGLDNDCNGLVDDGLAETACNDSDACTTDSCNPATGACVYTPIAGCCASDADCSGGLTCDDDRCCEDRAGDSCSASVPCCSPDLCQNGACCNRSGSVTCYTDGAGRCCSGVCIPFDTTLPPNAPGHNPGACQ